MADEFVRMANEQLFLSDVEGIIKICVKSSIPWQRFFARSSLLSVNSLKIKSMLNNISQEKKSNFLSIVIDDFPPRTVHQMLRFCYTKTLPVCETDDLLLLTKLADKYIINELKEKCEHLIESKLSLTNILKIYQSVFSCHLPHLTGLCERFISAYFSALVWLEDFVFLDIEAVQSIISLDALNVRSEFEVYDAVRRWSSQKCAEKGLSVCEKYIIQEGKGLFACVRYRTMTDDEKQQVFPDTWDLTPHEISNKERQTLLSDNIVGTILNKTMLESWDLSVDHAVSSCDATCLCFIPQQRQIYLAGFKAIWGVPCKKDAELHIYCNAKLVETAKFTFPVESVQGEKYIKAEVALEKPLQLKMSNLYTVKVHSKQKFQTFKGIITRNDSSASVFKMCEDPVMIDSIHYIMPFISI